MAFCLYELGRKDEAITKWQQALSIEPNSPDANAGMGMVLYETGRQDEGISYYRNALRMKAEYADEAGKTVRHFLLDNDYILLIRFDIGMRVAFRERLGVEITRLSADQSGGGVSGGVVQYVTQLGTSWETRRTPPPNQWIPTLSEN